MIGITRVSDFFLFQLMSGLLLTGSLFCCINWADTWWLFLVVYWYQAILVSVECFCIMAPGSNYCGTVCVETTVSCFRLLCSCRVLCRLTWLGWFLIASVCPVRYIADSRSLWMVFVRWCFTHLHIIGATCVSIYIAHEKSRTPL